jgi:hypothetical protein
MVWGQSVGECTLNFQIDKNIELLHTIQNRKIRYIATDCWPTNTYLPLATATNSVDALTW